MAVLFSGTACGFPVAVEVFAGPVRDSSVRRSPGHPAMTIAAMQKAAALRMMLAGGKTRAQ
jgi:hypothetical protein